MHRTAATGCPVAHAEQLYCAVQMSCDPAQLTVAGKEVSLSESVPVLVSLPVAAPQIQKELLPPTEGDICLFLC